MRLPRAVEQPFAALKRRRVLQEAFPVFARSARGRSIQHARASVAAALAQSVRDSESEDLRGIALLRLSRSVDLERVEKQLQSTRGIVYAHRVPARWAARTQTASDPLTNRQWNLRAVRWFQAHPLPDARGIKVGVLDTGIDARHPDLELAGYSHAGAGRADIVGHGTHVAGIIGARSNNNVGICGMCRSALWIWKIFGDVPAEDGEYYVDELMYQRALNAASNDGMRAVNLSIGGTVASRTEEILIKRLVDRGCVVVAAMGNEFQHGNPTEYPAAYDGVMAVGAVNEADRRAPFSNTGKHVRIMAPGVNVLSTLPMKPSDYRSANETAYAAWDGTSMAAPHVTAAAALLLAKTPDLTPEQVMKRLTETAIKVRAMRNSRRTNTYGHGLLDLAAALS
jgi:subtilisin family serine protease